MRYLFEDYVLDADRRELRRRGAIVPVEPQVFDLLAYLVCHRDRVGELERLGVAQLFGLSTQSTAYQREAVERLHLPFAILSDADLRLTNALKLPTFEVAGMTLLKRMPLRGEGKYML